MEYIIYHQSSKTADCPDGIMSAAVAALAVGGNPEIMGDMYRHRDNYPEKPEPELYPFKAGDRITIVDFSYPSRWLRYWESQGVTVTVIDHHAEKFPQLKDFANAILDKYECGATLSWKHFFPNKELPLLLIEVRRRDIGRDGYYLGKVRHSEAINEGLATWRHSFRDRPKIDLVRSLGEILLENSPKVIEEFRVLGEDLLLERDRLTEYAAARVKLQELSGYQVPFVVLNEDEDRHYSHIGNHLALMHPDHAFAWVQTSDGRSHLRSTGSPLFSVQPIATANGGGGHPPASGFPPFV